MRHFREVVIFIFALTFFSASSLAFDREDLCESILSQNECYAVLHADELIDFQNGAKKGLEDLRKSKKELEKTVGDLRAESKRLNGQLSKKVVELAAKAKENEELKSQLSNKVVELTAKATENEQLNGEIAGLKNKIVLLEPDAKRFQKFMQMFPHTNNMNSYF
jgi:chromosome segregation ATPase